MGLKKIFESIIDGSRNELRFSMTDKLRDRLDQMVNDGNFVTDLELFKTMLALMDHIIQARKRGYRLYLLSPKQQKQLKTKPLHIPHLDPRD